MDKEALRRRVAELIAEQMRMYFDHPDDSTAQRFEPLAVRIVWALDEFVKKSQ
jgi:hypothetical protein